MAIIRSMVKIYRSARARQGRVYGAPGHKPIGTPTAGRALTGPVCSGRLVGSHATSRDAGLTCTYGITEKP
jgi:hypothetical protein